MKSIHHKAFDNQGFTIMEIMIAAAILMVISLGVSQILVSSQRSLNRSDSYLVRQTLEKYISSMIATEASRCNSIKASGPLSACALMCASCLAGSTCSDPAFPSWNDGNCRNYGSASSPKCTSSNTGDSANKVYMPLKDFSTTLSNAANGRIGGDGLAGLTIIANLANGNKVTDAGVPCGDTYAAATSSCRWRVTASYRPDYNDAMRFYLSITYEPNESDDTTKIPARSWQMVVPVNELCSTL